MRALTVLLVLAFLFLLIRTGTGIRLDLDNLNPVLIGYGALFTAGIVMAEVLRPLMVRLLPVARFVVVITLAGLVWLGIDQLGKSGHFPDAFLNPSAISTTQDANVEQMEISPAWDGIYRVVVEVNNQALPMVVDLATPFVLLQYNDAARLGLKPQTLVFKDRIPLGDRKVQAAKLEIASVQLDGIAVQNVAAAVAAPGILETNILGLSFLTSLDDVALEDGTLVLKKYRD